MILNSIALVQLNKNYKGGEGAPKLNEKLSLWRGGRGVCGKSQPSSWGVEYVSRKIKDQSKQSD